MRPSSSDTSARSTSRASSSSLNATAATGAIKDTSGTAASSSGSAVRRGLTGVVAAATAQRMHRLEKALEIERLRKNVPGLQLWTESVASKSGGADDHDRY